MPLAAFLTALLNQGEVTVSAQLSPFSAADQQEALEALQAVYEADQLDLAGPPPAFDPGAALWAAEWVYRAAQLLLLREVDAAEGAQYLPDYPNMITPEAVYSADLVLRYLPDLLRQARGLAPGDFLVQRLQQTAAHWPFSAPGIPLEGEVRHEAVLRHPTLRRTYIDRLIKARDGRRIRDFQLREEVRTALGEYAEALWPEL